LEGRLVSDADSPADFCWVAVIEVNPNKPVPKRRKATAVLVRADPLAPPGPMSADSVGWPLAKVEAGVRLGEKYHLHALHDRERVVHPALYLPELREEACSCGEVRKVLAGLISEATGLIGPLPVS